jgi:hypothetical protein
MTESSSLPDKGRRVEPPKSEISTLLRRVTFLSRGELMSPVSGGIGKSWPEAKLAENAARNPIV